MAGEREERKEARPASRERKSPANHAEQVRLLLERAERETLRSISRDLGTGSPESAVESMYALELLRKMQKDEPLPPRLPKQGEAQEQAE